MNVIPMEVVKEPHLARLRDEVVALHRIVDVEPDAGTVSAAWASIARAIEALKQLAPNHPEIWRYR
jgi:hypothetical protein